MKAGSVILHPYVALDGTTRPGLFLVIYDELYDVGIIHKNNIIGLKITSTSRTLHYDVQLKKKYNSFLDHDSYVMCSKPHVLTVNNSQVIGIISPTDLLNVYTTYKRLHNQIDEQIAHSFMEALKEVF